MPRAATAIPAEIQEQSGVAEVEVSASGPSTEGVADDPEGAETHEEVRKRWESLDRRARSRVHFASLPMRDEQENAAMVNALQRRAQVVVQKSLAEGFGLTVSEAMWKSRPVVASNIGGIQDQIEDGVSGTLLQDRPTRLSSAPRCAHWSTIASSPRASGTTHAHECSTRSSDQDTSPSMSTSALS